MKIKWFEKRKKDTGGKGKKEDTAPVVQTADRSRTHPFYLIDRYVPLGNSEYELYSALREAVPIIDAALDKIVRLVGDFNIRCKNKSVENAMNMFLKNVKSDGCGVGITQFLSVYLNQLLTYGTAVGEIVLTGSGKDIYSLYNAPLRDIELTRSDNKVDTLVGINIGAGDCKVLPYQDLLLVSVLNPEPGKLAGTSLLKGLPFVSSVLLKIYNTIGVNWERVGNVRFAVTYKPSSDNDRAMSRQRAVQVAEEWSKAMHNSSKVSDFVSVGDVSIKVIGADNQILDSDIPVRQMLEQIIAKLSIPPFLLGLSWSTTERMSSQQADILTSELEYYRGILNGTVRKICDMWLRLRGISDDYEIVWDNINLQDEVELAQARYYNAQAEQLEQSLTKGEI